MPAYRCLNKQEFSRGAYSLVPLRYEDRFAIMRWRNQQIYHLRQSSPLTKEDQQRYFDQVVAGLFAQERPGRSSSPIWKTAAASAMAAWCTSTGQTGMQRSPL